MLVAQGKGRFRDTRIDVLGAESTYGPHARATATREVVVRIAASHHDRDALKLMLRELPQAGTSMAPGFATMVGGRPQPATMLKLFSFLIDKAAIRAELDLEGQRHALDTSDPPSAALSSAPAAAAEPVHPPVDTAYTLPLIALAYGRSGDKGNHSNIGIIAREARFVPLVGAALTERAVAGYLAHLLDPERGRVHRYWLRGPGA